MTRLTWGDAGERFFEAGVDRGVLYVSGKDGVPWNGLVSVQENPTGGEAQPRYFDGFKYSNEASREEFEATIQAFTYPDEFALCDGTMGLGGGLFASQQRRRPFSMAYRTKIGNDTKGVDLGYKLHILYNASVAPSTRSFATLGGDTSTANFSWKVTTRPPRAAGIRPTSHFTIDSREVSPEFLTEIEDIFYGTDATPPRLMTVAELLYRFDAELTGIYDAGIVGSPYYVYLDAGVLSDTYTSTIDGGTP